MPPQRIILPHRIASHVGHITPLIHNSYYQTKNTTINFPQLNNQQQTNTINLYRKRKYKILNVTHQQTYLQNEKQSNNNINSNSKSECFNNNINQYKKNNKEISIESFSNFIPQPLDQIKSENNLNMKKSQPIINKTNKHSVFKNNKSTNKNPQDNIKSILGNIDIPNSTRQELFKEVFKRNLAETANIKPYNNIDNFTTENLILDRITKNLLSPETVFNERDSNINGRTKSMLQNFINSQLEKTSPKLLKTTLISIINKYYNGVNTKLTMDEKNQWIKSLDNAYNIWITSNNRDALDDYTKLFLKKIAFPEKIYSESIDIENCGPPLKNEIKKQFLIDNCLSIKTGAISSLTSISDNVENIVKRTYNEHDTKNYIQNNPNTNPPHKLTLTKVAILDENIPTIPINKNKAQKVYTKSEKKIIEDFSNYANINEPTTKQIILEKEIKCDDGTVLYIPTLFSSEFEKYNKEINNVLNLQ